MRSLRLPPFFFLLALLIFFSRQKAMGWLHLPISDPELVQQSDLIVVARMKPDSIVYVSEAHPKHVWEHRAVLIIKKVIKGKCETPTLPIILRYGMDLVVMGDRGLFCGPYSRAKIGPDSQIEIGYQGGMEGILGDPREDHLWFLNHPPLTADPNDPQDLITLGVSEPEQFRPVELKLYFKAFLTPHPEEVLKKYAAGHSKLAVESQTYLNHLAIEEILKEPDVEKRARLLLPYFLFTDEKKQSPNQYEAALQLWRSCQKAGAALLVPYFKDPKYREMQHDIMLVWENAQYWDAIPLLADALDEETHFWQGQTPEQRDSWIHSRPNHESTDEQITSMQRAAMILNVFRHADDPRVKAEIAKVAPIWKQMFPPGCLDLDITEGLMLPQR